MKLTDSHPDEAKEGTFLILPSHGCRCILLSSIHM